MDWMPFKIICVAISFLCSNFHAMIEHVQFQYFIRPFKDKGGTLSWLESFGQEVRWLCRQREAQQTLVMVAVNLVATLLLLSWCHSTRSMGQHNH